MPRPRELIAKAQALASFAEDRGLHDEHILPTMGEWKVAVRIATVTGIKAQERGLAAVSLGESESLPRCARSNPGRAPGRWVALPGARDCARSRQLSSDRAWLP